MRFGALKQVCRVPQDNDRLLEEWFEHPRYDEYWQAEDCSRHFEKLVLAQRLVGAWDRLGQPRRILSFGYGCCVFSGEPQAQCGGHVPGCRVLWRVDYVFDLSHGISGFDASASFFGFDWLWGREPGVRVASIFGRSMDSEQELGLKKGWLASRFRA